MTREEAIKIIRKEYACVDADCDIERSCGKCELHMPSKEPILKAYEMAIQALSQEPTDTVSRGAFEQVMFERDIAIEQLHKLGYEWGQKIEPCDDAISRDAVLKLMDEYNSASVRQFGRPITGIASMRTDVRELPSVTQKSGKWIMSDDGLYRPICNKCGAHPWKGYIPTVEEATEVFKYCPNCGAKMESEE